MLFLRIFLFVLISLSHLWAGDLLLSGMNVLNVEPLINQGGTFNIKGQSGQVIGVVSYDQAQGNFVLKLAEGAPDEVMVTGLPTNLARFKLSESQKTVVFPNHLKLSKGCFVDTSKSCRFDGGIEAPHVKIVKGCVENSKDSTVDILEVESNRTASLIQKGGTLVVRHALVGTFDRLAIQAPLTCQGLMQVKVADYRLEAPLAVNTLILEKTRTGLMLARNGRLNVKRKLVLMGVTDADLQGVIQFQFDAQQLAKWEKDIPQQLKNILNRQQQGITLQFSNGQVRDRGVTTAANGPWTLQARAYTDQHGFKSLSALPTTVNTLVAQTQEWLGTMAIHSQLGAVGDSLKMDGLRSGNGTVSGNFTQSIIQLATDRDAVKVVAFQAPQVSMDGTHRGDIRQIQGKNISVGSQDTHVRILDARATETYEEKAGAKVTATKQAYKEGTHGVTIGAGAITDSPLCVTKSGAAMDLDGTNVGESTYFEAVGELYKGPDFKGQTTNLSEKAASFSNKNGATVSLQGGIYSKEATQGDLQAIPVEGATTVAFKAPGGKISVDGPVTGAQKVFLESAQGVDINEAMTPTETLYIKTDGWLNRSAPVNAQNIYVVAEGGIAEWWGKMEALENLQMESPWRFAFPFASTSAKSSRFDIDWLNFGLLNSDSANNLTVNTACQIGLLNWVAGHDRLIVNAVAGLNLGVLQSADAHMNVALNLVPLLTLPSFSGERTWGEALASWAQSTGTNAAVTLLPAPWSLGVRAGMIAVGGWNLWGKIERFSTGWDQMRRPAHYFEKLGGALEIGWSGARIYNQAKAFGKDLDKTLNSPPPVEGTSTPDPSFGWSDAWQIAGDPFMRQILPHYTENSLWHVGNPWGVGLTGYEIINTLRNDGASLWDVSFSRDVFMGWGNDKTNTLNVFENIHALGSLRLGGYRTSFARVTAISDAYLVLDRHLKLQAGSAHLSGATAHAESGASVKTTDGDAILEGTHGSTNEGKMEASGKAVVSSAQGNATNAPTGEMRGGEETIIHAPEDTATGAGKMTAPKNTVSGKHLRTTDTFVSEAKKTILLGQKSFKASGLVNGGVGKNGTLFAQATEADADVNELRIQDLSQATIQGGKSQFQDPRPQPAKEEKDESQKEQELAPPPPQQISGISLKLDWGISNENTFTKDDIVHIFLERYGVQLNDWDALALTSYFNFYITQSDAGVRNDTVLFYIDCILKRYGIQKGYGFKREKARRGYKLFNAEYELERVTRDVARPEPVVVEERLPTTPPTHAVLHDGLQAKNVDNLIIIGKGENPEDAILGKDSYGGVRNVPKLFVITNGTHKLDLQTFNPALRSFGFWSEDMTVQRGYTGSGSKDVGLQDLSLYAMTGDLNFSPQGSITGLTNLDLYGETGINLAHSLKKTYWYTDDTWGEVKTINFESVRLSANTVSLGTMGRFHGEAAKLQSTDGNLYLWARNGYENLGYRESFLANFHKKGRRKTYDWDTAFFAGSLDAKGGFVLFTCPHGGILHQGGPIHGDKGVIYDVRCPIRLEGLRGMRHHVSKYRGGGFFKIMEVFNPDRENWEETELVPTVTVGDGGAVVMRTKDNNPIYLHADMTGLANAHVELDSNNVQFYRSILQKGSKTTGWRFKFNWNPFRGASPLSGTRMIGQGLRDVSQGNWQGLMSLLPGFEARLTREEHTQTSEFLGRGGLVAGSLSMPHQRGNLIQHNGFDIHAGSFHHNLAHWDIRGATLHTNDTVRSAGLYARVGYNGQSVDASAGACADIARTRASQPVIAQSSFGYAQMPGRMTIKNGYVHVHDGAGHMATLTANTDQNSIITQAVGASVGVNPAGTASGEVHAQYDHRRLNVDQPTGLHVESGSVTVGEAILRGAEVTGSGVEAKRTLILRQQSEKDYGYNVGLSFTANQAEGQPVQPARATLGGRVGEHRFAVSSNLWPRDGQKGAEVNQPPFLDQVGVTYGHGDMTYLNDSIGTLTNPETYSQIVDDYVAVGQSLGNALSSMGSTLSDKVILTWDALFPDVCPSPLQSELQSEREPTGSFLVEMLSEDHGNLSFAEALHPIFHALSEGHIKDEVHLQGEPGVQSGNPSNRERSANNRASGQRKPAPGSLIALDEPFLFEGGDFKYRIAGRPYLLENPDQYEFLMTAEDAIRSSSSPFVKPAVQGLNGGGTLVFVTEGAGVPKSSEGLCSNNKDLKGRVPGSNGRYVTVSTNGQFDLGEKLVYELTHSRIYDLCGSFVPGHFPGNSLLSDANFFKLYEAWLADPNALKQTSIIDRTIWPNSRVKDLWVKPMEYFGIEFRNKLSEIGFSENLINSMLEHYGLEFLNSRPIQHHMQTRPGVPLSLLYLGAYRGARSVMIEAPAWSAGVDFREPGIIREFQPEMLKRYQEFYFNRLPLLEARTPFELPNFQKSMRLSHVVNPGSDVFQVGSKWLPGQPLPPPLENKNIFGKFVFYGTGALTGYEVYLHYNEERESGYSVPAALGRAGVHVCAEFFTYAAVCEIPILGQAVIATDLLLLPYNLMPTPNWENPGPIEEMFKETESHYQYRQENFPFLTGFLNPDGVSPVDQANIPIVSRAICGSMHKPINWIAEGIAEGVFNAMDEANRKREDLVSGVKGGFCWVNDNVMTPVLVPALRHMGRFDDFIAEELPLFPPRPQALPDVPMSTIQLEEQRLREPEN